MRGFCKFLLIVLLVISIPSCDKVLFETVQPENSFSLRKIPGSLRGDYKSDKLNLTLDEKKIFINGVRFDVVRKIENPNTEVVVRYYNENYFVNFNFNGHFWVSMLVPFEDEIALFMAEPGQRKLDYLNKISDIHILADQDIFGKSYIIANEVADFEAYYGLFDVYDILKKR